MIRKKRILFAAVDIGYRIEPYSSFIDKNYANVLKAESFSKYILPEEHYKTSYTYTCPINKTHPVLLYMYCFFFFLFSLFRYDIFHFLSGETLLTRKLRRFELAIYKMLGKRVIMHFVGSDIRNPEYLKWKERNIKEFLNGLDNYPKSLAWQKKLIRDAEKYADYIIVSTPDLLELIPSAHYYPVMIDIEKFSKELNNSGGQSEKKKDIVILHCPSSTKVTFKGTTYINEVLSWFEKEKSNVKAILPAKNKSTGNTDYPVSRYELFKLFQEADIVIDQLIIGWYGLQTVEALAAGNKVICYIDKKLEPYLFPDCPIILADVNNLKEVITDMIAKSENSNTDDSKKQKEWINKYHVIENNNSELLRAWNIDVDILNK